MVADVLTKEYGSTLKEGNTDVLMAEKVVKRLTKYLWFSEEDISVKKYNEWKKTKKY